jgi:hypothetical protein
MAPKHFIAQPPIAGDPASFFDFVPSIQSLVAKAAEEGFFPAESIQTDFQRAPVAEGIMVEARHF